MIRRHPAAIVLVVFCLLGAMAVFSGCGGPGQSTEARAEGASNVTAVAASSTALPSQPASASGSGQAALDRAAKAGKYLFAFFWKTDDESTRAMRLVFDGAMKKVAQRADSVAISVTDAAEKAIVEKYGLDRAPMPLALAIAPNGAITGGFPSKFEEKDLLDAFATPRTEKCMKALQDGKLVFLCVQNASTQSNDAAMKGVKEFQADAEYSAATEIITLDPADASESRFLSDLQVSPDTKEAVTVLLAPPGAAIAKYSGATDKAQLVETLKNASSSCPGGTCGPGGCAPK